MKRLLNRADADKLDAELENRDFDFDTHLETGFQLASFQGPLCAEPVEGIAYFVESLEVDREGVEKEISGFLLHKFTNVFLTSPIIVLCSPESNRRSDGVGYNSYERCMPEWLARLVATAAVGNVHL